MREAPKAIRLKAAPDSAARVKKFLPFVLTAAQEGAFEEIRRDLAGSAPMNRLLQGDVGAGKTAVALLAILLALEEGVQAALMAPTEILAEQHFLSIAEAVRAAGRRPLLLTGGSRNRGALLRMIANGEADLVVGTHALCEEEVSFSRLGLVVIDEQHKFGVMQRSALTRKGGRPDLLVMTATPIPRTLALTLYGDLDISLIDESPPGRGPVATELLYGNQREKAYRAAEEEMRSERQVYVVVPAIEEEAERDLRVAVKTAEELAARFPARRVGLLHGRMTSERKEETMAAFKKREIDLLVCTTVIEVGIDVANATLIIIEHAERFGLAQLHQLRGRVGRGPLPSRCIFLCARRTEEAIARLSALTATQNGFEVATADLRLRGPGEMIGTRQSGYLPLKIGDLLRDEAILLQARQAAEEMVSKDPELSSSESAELKAVIGRRFAQMIDA